MAEERFWSFFSPEPNTGCWLWTKAVTEAGYGITWIGHGLEYAHRLAFAFATGCVLDGVVVCHRCDNPCCGNPAHLFGGTQADNIADMHAKGRNLAGEQCAHSVLTEMDVLEIRRLCRSGLSQRAVAKLFGVTRANVSAITLRRSWAHVPEEAAHG